MEMSVCYPNPAASNQTNYLQPAYEGLHPGVVAGGYGSGAYRIIGVGQRLVSQFELAIIAGFMLQSPVNPTFG